MADYTTTANLALKKPILGGSDGKWGEYINENLETIGAKIVDLQNASTARTLESLSNVLNTTPTTGQVLQYGTAEWSAATLTIPSNLQDLTNVTISSLADGQLLTYNAAQSRWENQVPGAATIPDGSITTARLSTTLQGQINLILQTTGTPTDNQILRYDGISQLWNFENLPGGTVAALTDTDVTGLANKDVLVYSTTSGNWVSRQLTIADITNLQTTLDAKLESVDITVSALTDTTITSIANDSFLVYDSSDSKWKNEGPSTVRSTLSLVVGTNVQAQSARLDDISSLAVTDGNFIVGSGTGWVAESGATARASLGLTIGTDVEAYSSSNADYSDTTANFTGTLQNGGSNVLVDSDIGSTVQGYDVDTAKYNDTTANFTGTLQNGGSNVVVDSDIGSLVQAYDANTTKNNISNTFTTNQVIRSSSNTNTALRVTQTGVADALRIEDEMNPDSTPFVINSFGKVGLGTSSPSDVLHIEGSSNPAIRIRDTQATDTYSQILATSNNLTIHADAGNDFATSSVVIKVSDNTKISFHKTNGVVLNDDLLVNGNSIVSASGGNIAITPDTTGKIILDGLSWPTADGSADQVLKTDGSGNLSFGLSDLEHSNLISTAQTISSGQHRMYVGPMTFSNDVTVAGKLLVFDGLYNTTGTINITGTLHVRG